MSKLREEVWIIQGRKAVSRVVRSCVICRRFRSKSVTAPPAALPEDRIQSRAVFETTGVDLAGPLFLRGGKKVWTAIFVCATYRAIHLELVDSCSTEDFILAFSRFCFRRGRPTTIYSDNGTNFVGAENLFELLDWKQILEECKIKKILWKFNPPAAPWWGGFYERLIQEVKGILRRMLGHQKLKRIHLETCLYEVESIVNGRPLTFVTEDQDDLIPLTPQMFIHELSLIKCPESDCITDKSLRNQYTKLTKLREELKSRFRSEYLAELVHRGKSNKHHQLQVGDVVLVEVDNKKRLDWPMGRIMERVPGRDGHCRKVKVKVADGILIRPIQRLFPLEVSQRELDVTQAVLSYASIVKKM